VTDIAFLFNGDTDEEWERGDREVVDMAALYVGVVVE
jgi:hypothetical protein